MLPAVFDLVCVVSFYSMYCQIGDDVIVLSSPGHRTKSNNNDGKTENHMRRDKNDEEVCFFLGRLGVMTDPQLSRSTV